MQTPKRYGLALPWLSRGATRERVERSRTSSLGAMRSLSQPLNSSMFAHLVIAPQQRALVDGAVPDERRQLGRSATKTRIYKSTMHPPSLYSVLHNMAATTRSNVSIYNSCTRLANDRVPAVSRSPYW